MDLPLFYDSLLFYFFINNYSIYTLLGSTIVTWIFFNYQFLWRFSNLFAHSWANWFPICGFVLSFFFLSFFFILSFDYTRQWFLNSDINEIAQCDFRTIFLILKSLISGFIILLPFLCFPFIYFVIFSSFLNWVFHSFVFIFYFYW